MTNQPKFFYIVVCQFTDFECVAERNFGDCDYERTILDLKGCEWDDNVTKVYRCGAGGLMDVTADMAREVHEILKSEGWYEMENGEPMNHHDFVGSHIRDCDYDFTDYPANK